MIELLVVGFLALVAIAVLGVLTAGLSLVLWVVFLPFQLLGLALKGLGFLLAIPFLLLFALVGVVVLGFGAAVFFVPFLPFALIAFLVWRWMRGRPRATVSA